jgi:hypothetical protein
MDRLSRSRRANQILEDLNNVLVTFASRIHYGRDNGVGIGASLGAEATADLAMDDRIAQRPFGSIVIIRDIGMIEEDKQSLTMLVIAAQQLESFWGGHRLRQQHVTIGFQAGHRTPVKGNGQLLPSLGQTLRTQQQLLEVIGPGRSLGVNGELQIAQLVGVTDR